MTLHHSTYFLFSFLKCNTPTNFYFFICVFFLRLLHPFSPKGKLVHLGKEGLETTTILLEAAKKHSPNCVVRDKIFRIALAEKNMDQLKQTAELHPEFATWMDADEIKSNCGTTCLGGVVFSNGCQVIHVPSYLEGLWKACKDLSDGNINWSVEDQLDALSLTTDASDWKEKLSTFDVVVFSAGSGLFHDAILGKDDHNIPVDLVRGQSVEMTLDHADAHQYPNEAILCGKYIAPIPDSNQILIGATHEYKEEALDESGVLDELKKRSYELSPFLWDKGSLHRITNGYRVQSRRGKYGRMPIIGALKDSNVHYNAYIFTGLSARGLIYHGIYGKLLSNAIVAQDENILLDKYPEILWWK